MGSHSHSTREALLRREAEIHATQAALEKELLEIHRSINAVAPFHRLPLELIVDIFHYIYDSLFVDPNAPNTLSQWLQIPSVCHHWRTIVFFTPVFWRYIKVRAEAPEWLSLSLSCARGDSTEIYFRGRPRGSWDELSAIMVPYVPSIRLISLALLGTLHITFLGHPRIAPMHALSTLRVTGDVSACQQPILLHKEWTPNLTSLTLHNVDLNGSEFALYNNLHHLQLDTCAWPVDVEAFLSILAASPNLATLVMIRCIPIEFGDDPPDNPSPIALPALRTLRVEYNTIDVTVCALKYISVPNATYISIIGNLDSLSGDYFETITDILPLDPESVFPSLQTVCSADLVAQDVWRIRLRNASGVCIELGVHRHFGGAEPWDDGRFTEIGISDILALCRGAPLTSLTMRGSWHDVYSGRWQDVFTTFPALEELALSGWGGPASVLFDGLAVASRWAAVPPGCCPALRTISLDGLEGGLVGLSRMRYESVVGALQLRAQRGHPQLDVLRLRLEFASEEEYDDAREKYGGQLATLAREVSFTYMIRDERGGMEVK